MGQNRMVRRPASALSVAVSVWHAATAIIAGGARRGAGGRWLTRRRRHSRRRRDRGPWRTRMLRGRVQIDVHFDCALAPPAAALTAAGLAAMSTVKYATLCVVEGWALPTALPQIAAVAGVIRVSAPSYVRPTPPRGLRPMLRDLSRLPERKQGTGPAIDENGIVIMRADQFIAQDRGHRCRCNRRRPVRRCIQPQHHPGRGELPPSVQVLYPAGNPTPVIGDEGTALLEEVHAVAPGATLVYCGPTTFVDFTSCMTQLINAGATVLLDDSGLASDVPAVRGQ